MGIVIALLYFVFVVAALLLIVIVLLQESKGGGLAEAFGGMGAETFGVKTGGINKATATLAAIFLGAAVLINVLSSRQGGLFSGDTTPAPVTPAGDSTPADDTSQD